MAEVTQSEIAQKQKLQTVLERINDALKVSSRSIKWNVDCTCLKVSRYTFTIKDYAKYCVCIDQG